MDKKYPAIWEKIDFVHNQIASNSEAFNYICDINQQVQGLLKIDNSDKSELYCMLGYIGYHFNDYFDAKIDIEENFKKSLQYNSNQCLAWLYLGYYYFDTGNWKLSLESFCNIDNDTFSSFSNELQLKILELKLCCSLQIIRPHSLPDEAKTYFLQLNSTQNASKPYPTELIRVIANADYLNNASKNELLNQLNQIYS